ncbi:MAG: sulfite exporter TauE/SafE family protein [Chitinophagales bacterium]
MWLEILPYLLAVSVGFRHAFETDHLMAVSNIVTKRNSAFLAMKDGAFWGLGHSSSILVIGIAMISLRWGIPENYFRIMEGAVGIMIIMLGIFRLWQFFKQVPHIHIHVHEGHQHAHLHTHDEPAHKHLHKVSYGVGIIHGLAGSGVLIAAAMAAMHTVTSSILFLVVFSIGCIAGMLVAAGMLGLPFSKKLQTFGKIQSGLVVFSCVLCLVMGTRIMMENWF